MIMKRLFFTISLLLVCTFSFAQQYGIKGGFNFSTLTSSGNGGTFSTDTRTCFQIGFMADYNLSNNLYFSPELLYMEKGGNDQGIGYIQIPLHLTAKYEISRGTNFFFKTGPFFAVGVSADNGLEFGSNRDLTQMDFGWDFGTGVEIGKIQLGYNFGLGLTNISQYNETVKTRVHSLTIGFFF